jgi:hypothetical protein
VITNDKNNVSKDDSSKFHFVTQIMRLHGISVFPMRFLAATKNKYERIVDDGKRRPDCELNGNKAMLNSPCQCWCLGS